MTPHTRTSLALGLALLLWLPAAYGILVGSTEVSTGGLVFLGALTFSWIGTGVLQRIMEGYAEGARRVERAKLQIEFLEQQAEHTEKRRKEDQEDADERRDRHENPPDY